MENDFIRKIIAEDLKSGKHGSIHTRFPPEPNGFLHIGHSKAICLNFGVAQENAGATCNLRFDDTNPVKEEEKYALAIKRDIEWLGFRWDQLRHTSDYFPRLYEFAIHLIKTGKAYVCDLSFEEARQYRGTLTEPGQNSPFRDRSIDENLELFAGMKRGDFDEGSRVLRAKIDMTSGNINMRDPTIYRILKANHPRTGDDWKIYPMYDYAHCISDALEGITHSLCTLEFEDHRPLYDWFLDHLPIDCHPRQIEFAKLQFNYTLMSKRNLIKMVDEGIVSGWDDPRMPTLAGARRRGYPPAAIRRLCRDIGIAKSPSVVDLGQLEHAVRSELDESAPRAMCVLRPLKVIITTYPKGEREIVTPKRHPKRDLGNREVPFTRELYIDRDDFMERPPAKFFRLGPGREVRLRNAYTIKCEAMIKNDEGEIVELHCSHDPATLGTAPAGRKVKGIIHWVSAQEAVPCEVRLYDRLFSVETPGSDDLIEQLNPKSREILTNCLAEPSLGAASSEAQFQFERLGYFCVDADSRPDALVFNRTVGLRDTWAKIAVKSGERT